MNWRKYTLPSGVFCQYCWVLNPGLQEQMNPPSRNWVQLCSHRLSARMICLFLYLKCKIPPLQMKGTKQMKHEVNLKWPIRKTPTDVHQRTESLRDWPTRQALLSIRDLSTGVSANALNSICTNMCNVRSLRKFSDYTLHCQDHSSSIHFWTESKSQGLFTTVTTCSTILLLYNDVNI